MYSRIVVASAALALLVPVASVPTATAAAPAVTSMSVAQVENDRALRDRWIHASVVTTTNRYRGYVQPRRANRHKRVIIQRKRCAADRTCKWSRYQVVRTNKRAVWRVTPEFPQRAGVTWTYRAVMKRDTTFKRTVAEVWAEAASQ